MTLKNISTFVVAALMLSSVVSVFAAETFVAPTTPEEAVAAREALMKSNGGTLRGAGSATGADAEAAMQTLLDNYTHIPAVFPEGSIVGDSKALPEIWTNWEAFNAIVEKGKTAATTGLAAAKSGDMVAYADAIKVLGATCGECHQQFRGK